jgi:hypothetical protein
MWPMVARTASCLQRGQYFRCALDALVWWWVSFSGTCKIHKLINFESSQLYCTNRWLCRICKAEACVVVYKYVCMQQISVLVHMMSPSACIIVVPTSEPYLPYYVMLYIYSLSPCCMHIIILWYILVLTGTALAWEEDGCEQHAPVHSLQARHASHPESPPTSSTSG